MTLSKEELSGLAGAHAMTERKASSERVSEALEQLRIAVEAEAAAKAKRDQFLAAIYVNVQKSEPTAEFAVALRDFVREEWPKLSAIEAPAAASEVTEDGDEERRIDALRVAAFRTNAEADRLAYFEACSKWFQDRHYRRIAALKGDRSSASYWR